MESKNTLESSRRETYVVKNTLGQSNADERRKTFLVKRSSSKAALSGKENGNVGGNKVRKVEGQKKGGNVVGVAQRKLCLKKPVVKATAPSVGELRSYLPSASKTFLYDDHWASKQERGFTKWLNFILAPTDALGQTLPNNGRKVTDMGSLQMLTNSDSSVKSTKSSAGASLEWRKKESRWRRAGVLLYQSEATVCVLERLEVEIEAGRLGVRSDCCVESDVGLRQRLLDMLFGYNPVWLKLGLEVVYGEVLPVDSCQDVQGLVHFISSRLFFSTDIASQYSHPSRPDVLAKGYSRALSQFLLKKFLLLVFFLDRAKLTRLIDHDPCLFCVDAEIKSSRNLLLELSRQLLCGEGDVTRHLGYIGYSVTYEQSALQEFDYTVTNLATDLRDGLRLTRLVEVLSGQWDLTAQLRVPVSSKNQKLHNVGVALKALSRHTRVPSVVTAQSVVEGHREKTLTLLWTVIFHFKVNCLLNEQELHDEVAHLNRLPPHPISHSVYNPRRSSLEPNLFFQSTSLSMLLDWCRAIGRIYGVPVTNFTSSFSDGRMMCCLVHHYHPSLLPLEKIHHETTVTQSAERLRKEESEAKGADNWEEELQGQWTTSFSPTTGVDKHLQRLLGNEKLNFRVLSDAVQKLGGVPPLMTSCDMSNTLPDEKVVIAYVTYLCHYLLVLRNETRAAICIQKAWRKKNAKLSAQTQAEKECKAATVIQTRLRGYVACLHYRRLKSAAATLQKRWRARKICREQRTVFMQQKNAAVAIQRWYRRRRQHRMQEAAVVLQKNARAILVRRCYIKTRSAVVVLQSAVRRWMALKEVTRMRETVAAVRIQSWYRTVTQRRQFVALKRATATIQMCYRATRLARDEQTLYLELKFASIILQACTRGWLVRRNLTSLKGACHTISCGRAALLEMRHARKAFLEQKKAAVVVQRAVRSWRANRNDAACRIQASFRGYHQRKEYQRMKEATVTLQRQIRACLACHSVRRNFLQLKQGCVHLQARIRGLLLRQVLGRMKVAAVTIQAAFRGYRERKRFITMKKAVRTVEASWMAVQLGRSERERFTVMKASAVLIQSHLRGYQVRRQIQRMKDAACLLQQTYRAHLGRRVCAATKIQSHFRCIQSRSRYLAVRQAAVSIQTWYSGAVATRLQREAFLRLRASVVCLQACFRGRCARAHYTQMKEATLVIQKNIRACQQRRSYLAVQQRCVLIQQWWRAQVRGQEERELFLRRRDATVFLQACVKGFLVRLRLQRQHQAASLIQRAYRAHLARRNHAATSVQSCFKSWVARKRYLTLKSAAVVLQQRYRALQSGRAVRVEQRVHTRAALVVQAVWRMHQARCNFLRQREACVTIQSSYRSWVTRQQYLSLRRACVVMQTVYRATRAMQQVRQTYLLHKKAAVVVQSHLRGHNCQRNFLRKRVACTAIQCWWRGVSAQRRYQTSKSAAVLIQRYYRSYRQMTSDRAVFELKKEAAVVLQSHFRRQTQQNRYHTVKKSTVCIQAAFRGLCVYRQYTALRCATVVIQQHFRNYQAMVQCRRAFIRQRNASLVLQAHFRRYSHQKQYRELKQATVVLQSAVRMHIARKDFKALQNAVSVIETRYQAAILGRLVRDRLASMQQAAVVLQTTWRTRQAQSEFTRIKRSATVIQAAVRCLLAKRSYSRLKCAAKVIQEAFRRYKLATAQRQAYLHQRTSAIVVQSHWKRFMHEKRYQQKRRAAVKVQAFFRCYRAQKEYVAVKRAARVLQDHWRAHQLMCMEKKAFLQQKSAVVILQAAARGWAIRRDMERQSSAATLIQAHFRRLLAQQLYLQMRQACITLQAVFRGHLQLTRFNRLRAAACILQCHYRCYRLGQQARHAFLEKKAATLVIQQAYRRHREKKAQAHSAAVIIQAAVRGWLVRQHYNRLCKSATTIQATVRGYLAHWRYTQLRSAAVTVQRRYRAQSTMKECIQSYQKQRRACTMMQAAVRGWRVRKRIAALREAVRRVERNWLARKERRQFMALRLAAVVIQRGIRQHLLCTRERREFSRTRQAAVVIQSFVRRWFCQRQFGKRIEEFKRNRAATAIQCVWRGYYVRRYVRTRAIAEAHARLEAATAALTENKRLRNKVNRVLEVLLKGKYLSQIVDALHKLELYTSVSEQCSELVATSQALPVLLTQVASSNRNRVTLEKAKVALRVLGNLAKWPSTCPVVVSNKDSLPVLVEMMFKVHNSHPDVFKQAGAVVMEICKRPHHAKHVSQMPLEMKKLRTMYDNLTRKARPAVSKQPPPSKEHHACVALMKGIVKALNC